MATVAARSGRLGITREVQFKFGHKRHSVRFGRCSAKQIQTARLHIERLLAQHATGHPADAKTLAWVAALPDDIYKRLAASGIVPRRGVYELGAWVDRCITAKEATDADSTTTRRKQAKRFLLEHFDANRDLRTITPGDADGFEQFLHRKKLAEATIRKRLADARQWFGHAIRHKLIDDNPFGDTKVTVPATDRKHYIDEATAWRVMEELPNARLRLVFALARWGGLRTPSEPAALRWDGVDWDRGRFTVPDVKRKQTRTVPMFPELVRPFHDWFDQCPPGAVEVFPGMSTNASALRRAMERAVGKAGVAQWPRLLHNLRASRQTDLSAKFPSHVVCVWLGNSLAVAERHYLQVREADYTAAVNSAATTVINKGQPQ